MPTTRRDFLRRSLIPPTLLSCSSGLPLFLARTAHTADSAKPDHARRVLVVIELRGGNDGLNTVVPYADETYRRLRPNLAIPANQVRKIDQQLGFHPYLGAFERLANAHRLCIVQGVGYPNPQRSHFESMTVWQSAQLDGTADTPGWLARTFAAKGLRSGADAPALHVRDSGALPQALTSRDQPVPSLTGIEDFTRRLGVPETAGVTDQRRLLDKLGERHRGQPGSLLDFVERTAAITYASSARLDAILREPVTSSGYPDDYPLSHRLQSIARLIKAGLTTPIYYTAIGDFDTHSNQPGTHPFLLRQVGDSVEAFVNDLVAAREADRVVVLLFSEFGRRLAENASGGTDHGTAAPVFLAGPSVRQLLVGKLPDLTRLDAIGDPQHLIDFRQVYATLLEKWLKCDSRGILGKPFPTLDVL